MTEQSKGEEAQSDRGSEASSSYDAGSGEAVTRHEIASKTRDSDDEASGEPLTDSQLGEYIPTEATLARLEEQRARVRKELAKLGA
jgi:hypothetical protein